MKSVQVTLMPTLDQFKNLNIPLISKSCVPYPRSTSLKPYGALVVFYYICYNLIIFHFLKSGTLLNIQTQKYL